jgi:hypothetical protein
MQACAMRGASPKLTRPPIAERRGSMTQPIRIVAAVAAALVILLAFAQPNGGAPPAYAAKKTPTPTASPTPGGTPLPPPPAGLRAGLRASNYGITPFPSPSWWTDSVNSMASRFPNATPEQIAVVVEVAGGGGRQNCWAHFPQPATGTYPNVNWDDTPCSSRPSMRSTPAASRSGCRSSRRAVMSRC